MNDDFNSPAALAVMQDYTRAVNTLLNGDDPSVGRIIGRDRRDIREVGWRCIGHYSGWSWAAATQTPTRWMV